MDKHDWKETIAQKLYDAAHEAFEVTKFTDDFPELDMETAYQIQEHLIEMICEKENTRIVGRKLGLTSKPKQQMMGVYEPTYGVLLKNMRVFESDPVSLSRLIHPKIEPEIAFVFDRAIKGPVSVPQVLAATAYVTPALEIIDSRYKDFKFTLNDVIADNSSSSRFILGEKYVRPQEMDLRLCGMIFKQNNRIVGTGAGAAVMGHPARAVAWMINKITQRGDSIKPGDVVLSGALCGSVTASKGDQFSLSIDGLGTVSAIFGE